MMDAPGVITSDAKDPAMVLSMQTGKNITLHHHSPDGDTMAASGPD